MRFLHWRWLKLLNGIACLVGQPVRLRRRRQVDTTKEALILGLVVVAVFWYLSTFHHLLKLYLNQ
jgi:hypothetical protein